MVSDRAGSRHAVIIIRHIRCQTRPTVHSTTAIADAIAAITSASCLAHAHTLTDKGELEQSNWFLLLAEAALAENTQEGESEVMEMVRKGGDGEEGR